ncbi:MAG: hypothetical protein ACRD2U_11400 [Terriglobales bacterium]
MFRRIPITALLVALSLPAIGFKGDQEDKIPGLIERAQSAPLRQQPGLYANIAERQLKRADELYSAGETGKARALLAEVLTYSDKASNAAIQSGKHLKNTEIAIRKMSFKLRDIKREVTFNDQAPLQNASDHLETLRTDLLARMFKKKK